MNEAVTLSDDAELMAASSKVAGLADEFAAMSAAAADSVDKAYDAGGDIAAMMANIAQAQVVAQGDMAEQMLEAAAGGDFGAIDDGFTGTAFDTAADKAAIGDLDPNSTADDAAAADSNTAADAADGTTTPTPTPTPEPTPDPEPEQEEAATFAVTEGTGADAGKWTVGTQNGNVTVTIDGANYVFTPTMGTAATVATTDVDSLIVNTITLTGTAAHLSGETITGTGTVAITALNATANTNLSLITATTVTANAAGNVTFVGSLGKAAVTVASGTMNVDDATMGTATFSVSSGATLEGAAAKLTGKTVTGAGTTTVTALAADTDLIDITPTTLNVTATSSISLAGVDLSNVDSLTVGSDGGSVVNVTVSSAQLTALSGKTTIGSDDSLTADSTAPTISSFREPLINAS